MDSQQALLRCVWTYETDTAKHIAEESHESKLHIICLSLKIYIEHILLRLQWFYASKHFFSTIQSERFL